MTPSIAIARYLLCAEERSPLRRRSWLPEKRFSSARLEVARWFFSEPADSGDCLRLARCSAWRASDWQLLFIPSRRFDTRLFSCTGSGHIRRPAALGLLLRNAPSGFRFLPKQIRSNSKERR